MITANNASIILMTTIMALLLSIMPLPAAADAFRPDWALIVLVYWSIALPNRVNVFSAWIVGFIVDVLLGSVLGVHAAAMAICIYISASNFQKIRNFSLWQQSIIVSIIVALYHLIVFWLQRFLGDVIFLPSYLYPAISSMVIWPWLFLLLRKIRRQFKVS